MTPSLPLPEERQEIKRLVDERRGHNVGVFEKYRQIVQKQADKQNGTS